MDAQYRAALINQIFVRIEKNQVPIRVCVPSTKTGVYGINTNALYGSMDEKSQQRHSVTVVAAVGDQYRNARRSDVIVKWVKSIGNAVRVDFEQDVAYFSVNKMPSSVLQRRKKEICDAFDTLLKQCSTIATLC